MIEFRALAIARTLLKCVAALPCTVIAVELPPSQTFELAPFIGYQLGGELSQENTGGNLRLDDHGSYALAIDARADAFRQYELFSGWQSTVLRGDGFSALNVRVEYLHVGGTVLLDDSWYASPYLAGGLGVSRLSPSFSAGHDDTLFSVSLALGLRVPVSRSFSVRLEGRGFATLLNGEGALFCHSGQSGADCQVTARGSTLLQLAWLAGVAYSF